MMFGFGDQWPPDQAALTMVDRCVNGYISDLARRAEKIADEKGDLDKECYIYLVRTDERKFQRINKLMEASEVIRKARENRNAEIVKHEDLNPTVANTNTNTSTTGGVSSS
jgi:hypothetical protein